MARKVKRKMYVATIRMDASTLPGKILEHVCNVTGWSASKAVSLMITCLDADATKLGSGQAMYNREVAIAIRKKEIEREAHSAARDVSKMSNTAVAKIIAEHELRKE